MKILITLFLCIVIGILLNTQKVEGACTQTDLNTEIANINALLEDLKDPSKTVTDNTINTKVADALAVAQSCENVMNGMIETKRSYIETYETDRCMYNTTQAEYKVDACCNPELFETTCCRARDVTVSRELLTKFKSKAVWSGCSPADADIEKVRSLVRYYKRRMETQKTQCDHVRTYQKFFQEKLKIAMAKCKTAIFATDTKCYNDNECYSNKCVPVSDAEAQTFVCRPASLDMTNGGDQSLARCLVSYLPNENLRVLQEALGLNTGSDLSLSELTTGLAAEIGKDGCIEERYDTTEKKYVSKAALHASQTACEADQACNDGNPSCANTNNFCGAFCDNSIKQLSGTDRAKGVCQQTTSFVTETECNDQTKAIGTCQADIQFHQSTSSSALVAKEEGCTDYKWCTLKCTSHPCDEELCQVQTNICFGPPPISFNSNGRSTSRCLVPYQMSQTVPHIAQCAAGQTDVEFGCVTDDETHSACKSNNVFSDEYKQQWEAIYQKDFPYPSWDTIPGSMDACTRTIQNIDATATEILYRTCKLPNGINTIRGEKQCSRCGGSTNTLYRIQAGSHREGIWRKETAWIQRQMVNKNRWTKVMDTTKFDALVDKVMKQLRGYAEEQYVACSTQPVFEILKKFTCGCESGTNCFQVAPRKSGSFIAYPNAIDHVVMTDVEVFIGRESIPASVSGGQKEIVVSTTQLDYDDGSETLSAEVPRYPINSEDGELVGMIVGNGVQLNVAYESGITVCLKVDRQANITVFNGPKFATYQDGKFVVETSVQNPISTKPNMVCGLVKDQNLYYPALVDVRRFRPPSSATTASISLFVLGIVVMMTLF